MKKLRFASTLLLGFLLTCGIVSAQQLAVESDTGKKIVLSRTDIETLDHAKVTVTEHPSDAVTFEGVKIAAVLERAGITFADGHTAVVAILFKEGDSPSPLLDTLWKNIPTEKEKVAEVASVSIDVKDLLPSSTGHYTYAGSLTTPPLFHRRCSASRRNPATTG
jgi:Eukaryotic-type carbonic anhydrase